MTVHLTIDCDEPWFSLLETGEKPVEGRKGKDKYKNLRPGDKVCFQCTGSARSFIATVEKVDIFKTVIDYINKVSLKNALPGVTTLAEALAIYSQWSTDEEIQKLGFVGIWIKPNA